MLNESWEDIVGFEGLYRVSSLGNIKSLARVRKGRNGFPVKRKEQLMKNADNGHGYRYVSLSKEGKSRSFYVHRLVSQHFILPIKNKPQVNHKNGIKTDNRVANLEWCSDRENKKHAVNTGLTKVKGEYNPMSKLTKEKVDLIRQEYKKGINTHLELSRKYGVVRQHVSAILANKMWPYESR